MNSPFMQEQIGLVIDIAQQHQADFQSADDLGLWLLDGFVTEMKDNHVQTNEQELKEAFGTFFINVSHMVWEKNLNKDQMIEFLLDLPKNAHPVSLSNDAVLLNFRSIAEQVSSLKSMGQEREQIKEGLKSALDNEISENFVQAHIPVQDITNAREESEKWVDALFEASALSQVNVENHVNETTLQYILKLNSLRN